MSVILLIFGYANLLYELTVEEGTGLFGLGLEMG